jgi:peptidoglycan/LPS O-acetylase OafA/YrhL
MGKTIPELTKNSYIPGIDGLRALAVLSVVFYHLNNSIIPGGFAGVDIFFVISGYVISRSLASSGEKSLRGFILGFYQRRILRIVPALLVCLVVTSIASTLFIPDAWLSELNKWTGVYAFFGASNFFLVYGADGYFSQRIPFNPFVHTWSLAVEEQFYLLFPCIVWLWMKTRNDPRTPRRLLFLSILPILTLASLAIAAAQTAVAPTQAFYLLPSRFWELALGALLFELESRRTYTSVSSATRGMLLFCGTALVALGLVFTAEARFPFPWAIPTVAGSGLMIAGLRGDGRVARGIRAILECGPVLYIGRVSYSLYLWHWPTFVLFRWTIGLTEWWTRLTALLIAFGAAALSFHFVEAAFRQNKRVTAAVPRRIVITGVTSLALSCAVVALLFKYATALGLKLTVTADNYDWGAHAYQPDLLKVRSTETQNFGKKLFVIGDSHADAYSGMATLAATSLGAEAVILAVPGCPLWNLLHPQQATPQCLTVAQSALELINHQASPGDVVFLASLRVPRLGNQIESFDRAEILQQAVSPAEIAERKLALDQASALVDTLNAKGLHILIDAPTPVFAAPAFRCSDWFNRRNDICAPGFTISRDLLLKLREPTMQSLEVLRQSHGVYVWDPFPVLCDGTLCSVFDGDKPKFSDGDHLSGYGNRLLIPSFVNQLKEIWGSRAERAPPPTARASIASLMPLGSNP